MVTVINKYNFFNNIKATWDYGEEVLREPDFVSNSGSKINKYNFFNNTKATWDYGEEVLREPDFVSNSGSKYWYDEFGVTRQSDHWGEVNGCQWDCSEDLRYAINRIDDLQYGYCNWENFESIE